VSPPCEDQVPGLFTTGTLRVLVHEFTPFTGFMAAYNADFEATNPGVKVDMSVVAPGDMAASIGTRLTAQDVDLIDCCVAPRAGFSNDVQPFMTGIEPPMWQQLIEANSILDITNEAFVRCRPAAHGVARRSARRSDNRSFPLLSAAWERFRRRSVFFQHNS
jgi:hypothetical protein